MNRSNISLVGNTTTAQNVGGGKGIYKGKVGTNDLQFKSLSGGTGSILIDNFTNPNVITLYSLSGGSIINLNNGFTGATSLGSSGATGVYKCADTCHQYFKSLSGGSGISISSDANIINICSTSLGTITGGTSLGAGTGVYKCISTGNLQFKSLSGGTGISIGSNANTINICSTSLGKIGRASCRERV